MMMILGMFVFGLPTLAYQELARRTNWKHPATQRVGRRASRQYTGKGDDSITLSGWIAPELTGTLYSLDALRMMADTGKSWLLIQGNGSILGSFIILEIDEDQSVLGVMGEPGRVGFTIKLERVDDGERELLGLGDISELRNMLSLDSKTIRNGERLS